MSNASRDPLVDLIKEGPRQRRTIGMTTAFPVDFAATRFLIYLYISPKFVERSCRKKARPVDARPRRPERRGANGKRKNAGAFHRPRFADEHHAGQQLHEKSFRAGQESPPA